LSTAKRDCKAALRFLRKAIGRHGAPEKITIDKSGADTAAIESYNAYDRRMKGIRRFVLAAVAAGSAVLLLASLRAQPNVEPEYVGAIVCAGCHATQAVAWSRSHHAKSMTAPTAGTVLGDFSRADPRFFQRGKDYFIRAEGPDGEEREFAVAATFGVAPLQQYLLSLPGGRLQAFSIAWDSRPRSEGGQRWFDLYPGERIAPGDPLHWTARAQNWNFMCADCHSTGVVKNYRFETDSYETRWREQNVACEACHGPGSRHVERAKAGAGAGLIVSGETAVGSWGDFDARGIRHWKGEARKNPSEEICAPCHSRRRPIAPARPGAAFLDAFMPELLEPGLYFADGQIEDEVFEWGSFQQSRMHGAGVTCVDCHEPHGAELRAEGNALCAQCHSQAIFDQPRHHRHAEGSPAARCVACHMPQRTYMQIHIRRDHSFRIPRPAASARLGAPNACNACHADKSADWAAERLKDWGATRQAPEEALSEIGRATRLAALAGEPGVSALEELTPALRAPSPLLRLGALRALGPYDEAIRERLAGPLRDDPVRAVRIEAARLTPLVDHPALEEWRAAERLAEDRSESHLNLGALAAERGEIAEAEREFQRATGIDSSYVPAWLNLADLLRATGRDAEAEAPLRKALAVAPADVDAHYALALWLVRQKRLAEARAQVETAAGLWPMDARFTELSRLLAR
jgi:predicted CXXCH cytochrome family protein